MDGNVENCLFKNEFIFKNINGYVVNGVVYYVNVLLYYISYIDIIVIGMIGYKEFYIDKLCYEIGVYYVFKVNLGIG